MSLRFIIGGAGAGKTHRLYTDLIRQAMEEPEREFFVIVPEQFTMQAQKDVIALHPRHGTMNIDITSFGRLAYRVFEELSVEHAAVLDDMGKAMVIRKSAAGIRDQLKLFGAHLDQPGFVEKLKSQLSECLQYGLTADELRRLSGEVQGHLLSEKLREMAALTDAFRAYIGDRMLPQEDIPGLLAKKIPSSGLLRDSVIALDGFTGFTPIQYQIMEALMRTAAEITVTVTMDPSANPYHPGTGRELFHLGKETVCRLIDLAVAAGCGREKDILLAGASFPRFQHAPALQFLEGHIFRHGRERFISDVEEADAFPIHLIRAKNPSDEAAECAASIRRLVVEEGFRYRDIAVICGDPEGYRELLIHAFDACGIPCYIDSKKSILENPAAELLRAALELLYADFSYEAMFRYLKTGLADTEDREGLWLLENYCLALGIRGFKRWNEDFTRTYRGAEEINLVRLNALRCRIMEPLIRLKERFSARGITVQERCSAIAGFMEDIHLEEKLEKRADAFRDTGDTALEMEYRQVYALILELLERVTALLGEETMSRREFAGVLDAGFAEIRTGTIPAAVDRVVVGDVTRTRLGAVKALFFLGVNDGVVPSVSSGGGVLSDAERSGLKRMQVSLAPNQRESSFQQRFYLYLALARPAERLILSWSTVSEDGKALRPAALISRLQALFPGLQAEDTSRRKQALWSESGRLRFAADCLRDPETEKDSGAREICRSLMNDQAAAPRFRLLKEAASFCYVDRGIGKAAARALYGDILQGSITRMELFESCAYAHFLSYGLGLQERVQYELQASDLGTIYHDTLERYFGTLLSARRDPAALTAADRTALVQRCVQEVGREYGNAIMDSSARNRYLAGRITRMADRTVWALTSQLSRGDFTPAFLEMDFSFRDNLRSMQIPLGEEQQLCLRGRIDRVDLCEADERIYLRILDYKTGRTAWSMEKLWYGLQLQLAVYLQAAAEKLRRLYPGRDIHPAGMFYYHIADPLLDRAKVGDKGDTDSLILKNLRMNGLASRSALCHLDHIFLPGKAQRADSLVINAGVRDGEAQGAQVVEEKDFRLLTAHAERTLRSAGRQILDGRISVQPWRSGGRSACDWCPYHGVCGFDGGMPGYQWRNLRKLKDEEVWSKMGRKAEDGSQMDGGSAEGN